MFLLIARRVEVLLLANGAFTSEAGSLQIPSALTNGKIRCLADCSHHCSQSSDFNLFHTAGSCCSFGVKSTACRGCVLDPCLEQGRKDTWEVGQRYLILSSGNLAGVDHFTFSGKGFDSTLVLTTFFRVQC